MTQEYQLPCLPLPCPGWDRRQRSHFLRAYCVCSLRHNVINLLHRRQSGRPFLRIACVYLLARADIAKPLYTKYLKSDTRFWRLGIRAKPLLAMLAPHIRVSGLQFPAPFLIQLPFVHPVRQQVMAQGLGYCCLGGRPRGSSWLPATGGTIPSCCSCLWNKPEHGRSLSSPPCKSHSACCNK